MSRCCSPPSIHQVNASACEQSSGCALQAAGKKPHSIAKSFFPRCRRVAARFSSERQYEDAPSITAAALAACAKHETPSPLREPISSTFFRDLANAAAITSCTACGDRTGDTSAGIIAAVHMPGFRRAMCSWWLLDNCTQVED
eukprot:scaffold24623_cov66-Phaeocystis_antarctica.AAC.7